METRKIGIILNGVTGRMGTNQHLLRSVLARGELPYATGQVLNIDGGMTLQRL